MFDPVLDLEVVLLDLLAFGQDGRPLDDVLELAYVPGPGVTTERRHGSSSERVRIQPLLLGELLKEVVSHVNHIFVSFPQGRNPHTKDIESVKEIFSERALFQGILERLVGGGDDSTPDLDLIQPPQAPNPALLQGPQELGLEVGRKVADLIQEERALSGQLYQAPLL